MVIMWPSIFMTVCMFIRFSFIPVCFSWPILVRKEILKIVEEMDTQEVDNMNIRATEDLMEVLMAPLEREVLEAPALVKTSGSTTLQHGLRHRELGEFTTTTAVTEEEVVE